MPPLTDSGQVGVFAYGAGTHIELDDVLVRGVRADTGGRFGNAVQALDAATIVLRDCEVRDGDGIGAIAANAAGSLAVCVVAQHKVGVHTQDGTTLSQVDGAVPDAVPESTLVVGEGTVFVDNESVTTTGTLPLPDAEGRVGG